MADNNADIQGVTKTSGHHRRMVERADKFKNDYIRVHGW